MRQVFHGVSLSLMQSDRDVRRAIDLGADPKRVYRTGNMKFTQQATGPRHEQLSPDCIGLRQDERLIVAGSTHADEEDMLLETYRELTRHDPNVVLLIAPRHLERVRGLEAKIHRKKFPTFLRSQIHVERENAPQVTGHRVIILDSQGELTNLYALGCLTFVGGTLTPIGGHNLLEPASWGKPVFFGPHTDHCEEAAGLLIQAGGGVRVQNGEELTTALLHGLKNPSWRKEKGIAAQRVVDMNQGAVARNVEMITSLLHPK